jgi:hypothetical protein
VTPQTLEPNAQRLKRREVTQMSKTKKLAAAALAVLALAVPATGVALNSGSEGVHLACAGSGGSGCYI